MDKRITSLLLFAVLIVTLLISSCGGKDDAVKTGLAVITSAAASKDASEADGLAQVDSTIAAVMLDADGKVIKCIIDQAQTKSNFDNSGMVVTPLDEVFKTKLELGSEYNMKKNSGIGKEWDEQAKAFAEYTVGKTLNEIKNISVNENDAADSDLASSVTIQTGDFITAVEKAILNAVATNASQSDKLGLGTMTNIKNSANAGDSDGRVQVYSTYAVITVGEGGEITGCIIDASQTNVNINASGVITSDLNEEFKTKNELGDAYNMKKNSGIGKEWNEQAQAFAEYVTGKTANDVSGIAIDEEMRPTYSDLVSSVTITVNDFMDAIAKAAAGAK